MTAPNSLPNLSGPPLPHRWRRRPRRSGRTPDLSPPQQGAAAVCFITLPIEQSDTLAE